MGTKASGVGGFRGSKPAPYRRIRERVNRRRGDGQAFGPIAGVEGVSAQGLVVVRANAGGGVVCAGAYALGHQGAGAWDITGDA